MKKKNKKVRHFVPGGFNRKSFCEVKVGKNTNITYIKCLTTCYACKDKLGIPLDFIDNRLVEGS